MRWGEARGVLLCCPLVASIAVVASVLAAGIAVSIGLSAQHAAGMVEAMMPAAGGPDTRAALTIVLEKNRQRPSDVRWSHATNSVAALAHATSAQRPVDFVEADIILDPKGRPVMAHPPATTSDLSFEAFVHRFEELAALESGLPLGLKLDFKHSLAVEPCLRLLTEAVTRSGTQWRHPIWLNADIFTGPGGNPSPFHAVDFLRACHDVGPPNAALSLGWTTGWSPWTCVGKHGYTNAQVQEALDALAILPRPMAVTWAVRASIIRQTAPSLTRKLLAQGRTLTVWGDAGEDIRRWLESPGIEHAAFVDVTGPALYLKATWTLQFFLAFSFAVAFAVSFFAITMTAALCVFKFARILPQVLYGIDTPVSAKEL